MQVSLPKNKAVSQPTPRLKTEVRATLLQLQLITPADQWHQMTKKKLIAHNLCSANNFVERLTIKRRVFGENSNLQIYSCEGIISHFHLSKETVLSLVS